MNNDIIDALVRIAKEKNIEKDSLRQIIETVFFQMIEKHYGSADNFDIIVNIDKGDIEIYQELIVVEDNVDLLEDQYDIKLSDARKEDEEIQVGDEFVKVLNPSDFGRRLITNAKQGLLQKIRDFEKELIVSEYNDRIGEIIIGDIHNISRRGIQMNIDKIEIFLPREEQIRTERLRRGDRVRGVITGVRNSSRGAEVLVSRRDPLFLTRLFEIEVPEIYDELIEICAVARIPGERAKVAVESIDKRIDPVGACVGMKGSRIQAISKELAGEKIDIVNYHEQIEIFIARALSPAKPIRLVYDEEENSAIAVIADEEMAQAIGSKAHNLQLAQDLTGVEIELIKESEYIAETEKLDKEVSLTDLFHTVIGPNLVTKLIETGYEDLEDLRDATINELVMVPGVDRKTAEQIAKTLAAYDEKQAAELELADQSENNDEEQTEEKPLVSEENSESDD
jgi:N utilization substance protein A